MEEDTSIVLLEKLKEQTQEGQSEMLGENEVERLKALYKEGNLQIEERVKSSEKLRENSEHFQSVKQEYKLYKRRHLVLTVYGMSQMNLNILFATTLSITSSIQSGYDVTATYVSNIALIFLFMYVVVTFPSSWMIERWGIQTSYFLASGLMLLGALLRMFINFGDAPNYSIFVLIISSVLIGGSKPIIMNQQNVVLRKWFPQQEWNRSVQILNFFVNFGLAVGTVIPGLMFSGVSFKEDQDLIRKKSFQLMMIEAGVTLGIVLAGFMFFRENPPSPPNYIALVPPEPISTLKTLKALFKNRDYVFLFLSYSLFLGTIKAVNVTKGDYLTLFGICDSQELSILLISTIPTGILGSYTLTALLRWKPNYKLYIICLLVGTNILYAVFYFTLHSKNIWLVRVSIGLVGFTNFPTPAVLTEWAQEAAYPLPETYIYGLMVSGNQLFGTGIGALAEYIIQRNLTHSGCEEGTVIDSYNALYESIFLACLFGASLFFAIFTRQDLKRTRQALQDNSIIVKAATIIEEQTNGNVLIKSNSPFTSCLLNLH